MVRAVRDRGTLEMFPADQPYRPHRRVTRSTRPTTPTTISERRPAPETASPKTALSPEKKSESQTLTNIERDEPELPAGASWRRK